VIVTGSFFGYLTFAASDTVSGSAVTLGNPGAPNALGREIFVAKVNPSGKWVWAVHAGSSGNDEGGRGVVALVDGSAIVTGFFNGVASFTPTASAQVSLTSAGGDLSNGWEQSRGVSVLPDGSAVVTGFYEDRAPTFTPCSLGRECHLVTGSRAV
jgi:hypothetical protein